MFEMHCERKRREGTCNKKYFARSKYLATN